MMLLCNDVMFAKNICEANIISKGNIIIENNIICKANIIQKTPFAFGKRGFLLLLHILLGGFAGSDQKHTQRGAF